MVKGILTSPAIFIQRFPYIIQFHEYLTFLAPTPPTVFLNTVFLFTFHMFFPVLIYLLKRFSSSLQCFSQLC